MQAVAPKVGPKPPHPALWLLVQLLIPVVGVLLLHWNLFGLIYLFGVELLLIGSFGLLRILTALGSGPPGESWGSRLGYSAMLTILFAALFSLILSFSLVHLDLDSLLGDLPTDNRGLHLSAWLLAGVFLLEWLSQHLLSGKYRSALPAVEFFRVFLLTLPVAIILVFVLAPYAEKLEGRQANILVILGILLAKTLIAFLVERLPESIWQIDQNQPEA